MIKEPVARHYGNTESNALLEPHRDGIISSIIISYLRHSYKLSSFLLP